MTVDGVLLGILSNYFRAAAEAAGYTLERTAHTTFIKESQDFSTGLITPSGEHFAYPTAIGADAYVGINYSPFIEALAPWKEGDIGIANCPYATKGVSTHLPDYHLLKPIFHRGELLGFAWAFIHCSDMGGIVAGSIQPSAYEIYQEGIRITPTKLYVEGVLQEELKKVFLDNVRIPDQNWGDLNAVIAALGVGELRVLNAVEKWGLDVVREGREALINYTEQRARDIIRTFPTYPYGVLIRVLPRGSSVPDVHQVLELNRQLFAEFALDYPSPADDAEFAAEAHRRYSAVWNMIGSKLSEIGDAANAAKAFDMARRLAPR